MQMLKTRKKNLPLQRFTLKKTKLLQFADNFFFIQCLALFCSKLIKRNYYMFNRNILLFLKFRSLEDNNYNQTISPKKKKIKFLYFYSPFFLSENVYFKLEFLRQKYHVQTSSSQFFFIARRHGHKS